MTYSKSKSSKKNYDKKKKDMKEKSGYKILYGGTSNMRKYAQKFGMKKKDDKKNKKY